MSGSLPEALAFCHCRNFLKEDISLRSVFSSCPAFAWARVTVGPQPFLQVCKAEAVQDACRDQPHSASGSILLSNILKEKAVAQQLIWSYQLCSLWRGTRGQELASVHPYETVSMHSPEVTAWTQSPLWGWDSPIHTLHSNAAAQHPHQLEDVGNQTTSLLGWCGWHPHPKTWSLAKRLTWGELESFLILPSSIYIISGWKLLRKT